VNTPGFVLLLAGAIPFLLNLLLTPLLLHIAHRRNWYDDVDHRKVHSGQIPRIGGVGIFLASYAPVLLLVVLHLSSHLLPDVSTTRLSALALSLLLIHIVGLLDDFANLRPLYKLFGQIAAALIPVISGAFFTTLALPFLHTDIELGLFGPVLTVLWLVGVCNAVNLIDGIDGLSASLSIIAALFFGLIGIVGGSLIITGIAFSIAGAVLAFFLFNFPPAKLFMGDSGSLYLGFYLALLPLYLIEGPASAGLALPLGLSLLLIPVLDTIAAIVRRRRQRKPFHIPDREHLHHKLLNFGFSVPQILAMMTLITLLPSLCAFLWLATKQPLLGDLTFILWVLLAIGFLIIDRLHRKLM
jgi:UDP-GlcNAc:undecaprenyl-phosphate GlcNAc-1-phosphate transferase